MARSSFDSSLMSSALPVSTFTILYHPRPLSTASTRHFWESLPSNPRWTMVNPSSLSPSETSTARSFHRDVIVNSPSQSAWASALSSKGAASSKAVSAS